MADIEGEWADWLIDSVALANSETAKTGESFLFDTIDVAQQVIGDKKCWDMYGWVVPTERLPEILPIWAADKDELIDSYYASVSFSNVNNRPVVFIDRE